MVLVVVISWPAHGRLSTARRAVYVIERVDDYVCMRARASCSTARRASQLACQAAVIGDDAKPERRRCFGGQDGLSGHCVAHTMAPGVAASIRNHSRRLDRCRQARLAGQSYRVSARNCPRPAWNSSRAPRQDSSGHNKLQTGPAKTNTRDESSS